MTEQVHRILVVEDEEELRLGIRDALVSEGYEVLAAADGEAGLELGLREDPDLILLDVMLPGIDGFGVLERLRADRLSTPIILMTALGMEVDRVRGLDLGADDYIVKPFGLAELLARVRSRLRAWDRERGRGGEGTLRFGDVLVDFSARAATRAGEDLGLTPLEIDLLACFAASPGRALSRQELLKLVWPDEEVVSRVVDTAILGLRKKVEPEPRRPRHILSVRNVGYRFEMRSS